MTLLDRFRTQPQKHPDPAVRLAHVGEIPLTERELIAAIAREDEDARVRKAAVAKLMDPAALGAIAQADADETVRDEAAVMLRDIALESFEGVAEQDSLDAVDALTDVRALSQIAKAAGREIVAEKPLAASSGVAWRTAPRYASSKVIATRGRAPAGGSVSATCRGTTSCVAWRASS